MQATEDPNLSYGFTKETIKELLQQNKVKKLSKEEVASRLQQTISNNKNSYHQSMSPGRVFMMNSGSNHSPKDSSIFSNNLQKVGVSINDVSEITFNKHEFLLTDHVNQNINNSNTTNQHSAIFGSDRNQSVSEESHVAMMG